MGFDIKDYLLDTDRSTLFGILNYIVRVIYPDKGLATDLRPDSMNADELLAALREICTAEFITELCEDGYGLFLTYYFSEDMCENASDYIENRA